MPDGIKRMRYVDYDWHLSSTGIVLDETLNTDALGWKGGDIFKLTNVNGKAKLLKVDPVEKFVRGFSSIDENQ